MCSNPLKKNTIGPFLDIKFVACVANKYVQLKFKNKY